MRSRWLWIALSLGVIAVVWGGWSWVSDRRFRSPRGPAVGRRGRPGKAERLGERFDLLVRAGKALGKRW